MAAISVNPAVGTSAPVWAAAAIGDTAVARAPARSAAGASALVRTAATAPLGVRGCPLRRLLPRCLSCQLELAVSVIIGRNRATGAARSRRPSAKTVLRTWHASGGLLRGEGAASDELLLVYVGEEG
jgi:hypothetical protein